MICTHGNNFLEGRKYPSLETSIEIPSTNREIPIGNPNGHRRPKPTTTLHNQFMLTNPPRNPKP